MPGSDQTVWHKLAVFGGISVELAACVFVGLFGGRWIDRTFHTEPIFLIVGILAGISAGVMLLIATIKRFLGD